MASFRRPDVVEPVLIAFGFVLLFAALPHALFGDDQTRFDDIEQLLHHGELSDSRYSLVMPLVASPFLLLGELVGSPSGWAARVNVIVLAAGASLIWLLLRDCVDRSLLRRTLLVVLFASFVTSKLRDFNAEILTATLATVGIAALVWSRHRRLALDPARCHQ